MRKPKVTVVLTALPSGHVDVVVWEQGVKYGQRVTIAPWASVLRLIAPDKSCRVLVRPSAPREYSPYTNAR